MQRKSKLLALFPMGVGDTVRHKVLPACSNVHLCLKRKKKKKNQARPLISTNVFLTGFLSSALCDLIPTV